MPQDVIICGVTHEEALKGLIPHEDGSWGAAESAWRSIRRHIEFVATEDPVHRILGWVVSMDQGCSDKDSASNVYQVAEYFWQKGNETCPLNGMYFLQPCLRAPGQQITTISAARVVVLVTSRSQALRFLWNWQIDTCLLPQGSVESILLPNRDLTLARAL